MGFSPIKQTCTLAWLSHTQRWQLPQNRDEANQPWSDRSHMLHHWSPCTVQLCSDGKLGTLAAMMRLNPSMRTCATGFGVGARKNVVCTNKVEEI